MPIKRLTILGMFEGNRSLLISLISREMVLIVPRNDVELMPAVES